MNSDNSTREGAAHRAWGLRASSRLWVAVGFCALLAAACGSSSAPSASASAKVGVKPGGTVTFALDETIPGWNVETSADNEFVLQEVVNLVQPQVFITQPDLTEKLNTDFVTSATQTGSNPQVDVYKINPKAVWQDGTPINADDFIYNWQAQSGNKQWTDVGGKPYDAVSTAGYANIKSVVGSNPPNGAACAAGSSTDRNAGLCPNGDTVTVTYSQPFADWQSIFADIIPAHIARVKSWNTGFTDYTNLISGSWYQISQYTPGTAGKVVLTKNPKYWGTPGNADTILFSQIASDDSMPAALQNGEVNVINPATVDSSIVSALTGKPGISTNISPGLEFEHFDFNEANYYLGKLAVRQALAYGTDRPAIIAKTVGTIDPNIKPLGNHMFMPNQKPYVNDGADYATVNVAKAKSLLQSIGGSFNSSGLFVPNSGPEAGKPLTFNIESTTGNPTRAATEELFQSQMKAIGVTITINNYAAGVLFGTNLVKGLFDIIEFAWVRTPFVSGNQSIYCSYTNTAICGADYDHYANPQVDTLLQSGVTASSLDAGEFRLQPSRQAALDRHGHPAAVPEAAVLRVEQHLREHRPQRLQHRHNLERPGLGPEGVGAV